MVKLVAAALEDASDEFLTPHIRDVMARAAIAVLRNPTAAMLDAGPPEPYMDKDVWAKMIDAALQQE